MTRALVVDASVVVDLLGRFRPQPIEDLLWAADAVLAAPSLMEVEVLQALRRLEASGAIPRSRTSLVEPLRALRIRTYPHASLLHGIWELRHRVSAYDAAYVVLARTLDATLVTRDRRLGKASGLGIEVAMP